VDASGRLTANNEGQGFLVATNALGADSVLAIVTRSAGGPVLRTSLSTYVLGPGDTTTFDLVLDPRSTPVGALTAIVSFNTQDFVPSYEIASLNVANAQVTAAPTNPNIFRFSVITTTPLASPTVFGRVRLVGGPAGSRITLTLTAAEVAAPDGQDLFVRSTSTFYPLTFR
jgi:hypothetical protein